MEPSPKEMLLELLSLFFGLILMVCLYLIPVAMATFVVKWIWNL